MTVTETSSHVRKDLFPTGRLFIAGAWREAAGGGLMAVEAPATGEKLTDVARATTADVDAAVGSARTTFDSGVWSGLPGRERARILLEVARLIRERSEQLGQIESQDAGKPIGMATNVDVNGAIGAFEYYGMLAQQIDGSVRETPGNVHAYVRREPLGVVAAITPFNFPLILSTSKVAPALAAGNSVVLKPADDTPLSSLMLAEILQEAGIPDGVFNVITGVGSELGDHLVGHPEVDKVAFTGSTEVGAHVAGHAGKNLRPVVSELGGNSANILFADADLDRAINTAIEAFVFNAGQFCMAGSRLYVERPVYEQVLERLPQAVSSIPWGDITRPESVFGPLISRKQFDRVARLVSETVAAGARVIVGGDPDPDRPGYFYPATVLADVREDHPAVAREVFGPVLTVQPFDTEEEVIAIANGTAYGLAGGVQTGDIVKGQRVSARLKAGIVWINGWGLMDPAVPFGGVKASGWGRENGPEGLNEYLQTKSIVLNLDS